jgi:hypothetical protein
MDGGSPRPGGGRDLHGLRRQGPVIPVNSSCGPEAGSTAGLHRPRADTSTVFHTSREFDDRAALRDIQM